MAATFGLLGLSICAVWFSPAAAGSRPYRSPWLWPFAGAIAAALVSGYLSAPALVGLGLLGLLAYLASRTQQAWWALLYGTSTAVLALALALHWVPGFNNPVLVANVKFSEDAMPFTQLASFDKAAAGLFLLAFLCQRASAAEWATMLRRTAPVAAVTAAAVIVAASAIGYVRPDPKLPAYTALFLATNLLFTCVPEEAFFRGFLQERLARALAPTPRHQVLSVSCSAVLFGVAHAAGGATYFMLATLAGLGYAYAYAITRRVEAPIAVHFAVNAVHFVGFTYPRLA